jgi:hypothetical protein
MESVAKEIRVDPGEETGNGRVGTAGDLRNKYCNFERAHFEWTNECVGGHNSSQKTRGRPQVKEHQDNAIASLDSCKRKWLNRKQRKSAERGTYEQVVIPV